MLLAALLVAFGGAQAPDASLAELTDREVAASVPRCGESVLVRDSRSGELHLAPAILELRERMRNGDALDVEAWRTILIDRGYLRWRKRWPMDVPFAVSLHVPMINEHLGVVLTPSVPGWSRASSSSIDGGCTLGSRASWEFDDRQQLGMLRPDTEGVTFDVRVTFTTRRPGSHFVGRLGIDVGKIRIDVRPVESLDEALPPTADPRWGAEIASSLRLAVLEHRERGALAHLVTAVRLPPQLACDLEATLFRKGEVVSRFDLDLAGDGSLERREVPGLAPGIASGDEPAEGWTLRLRGASKAALHDWDATHSWAGEFEIPVADLVARSSRAKR